MHNCHSFPSLETLPSAILLWGISSRRARTHRNRLNMHCASEGSGNKLSLMLALVLISKEKGERVTLVTKVLGAFDMTSLFSDGKLMRN